MMEETTCHIGILTVALHIPAAQSLKEKRMVLKSIKDRVRGKFNVSVAELDGQDTWQRSTLGFAMISSDNRYLNACLSQVLEHLHHYHGAQVCEHKIEFY